MYGVPRLLFAVHKNKYQTQSSTFSVNIWSEQYNPCQAGRSNAKMKTEKTVSRKMSQRKIKLLRLPSVLVLKMIKQVKAPRQC